MTSSLILVGQASGSHATEITYFDAQGTDDVPGQADLVYMGVDSSHIATEGFLYLEWAWDDTGLNGKNTGDACALIDVDGDGFVDRAVCSTIGGDPATLQSVRLYTCNDTRTDRCAGDSEVLPYPPAGSSTSWSFAITGGDSVFSLWLDLGDVGGTSSSLLNSCSFNSQEPNSNPPDCVLVPGMGVTIQKLTSEPTADIFDFEVELGFDHDGDPATPDVSVGTAPIALGAGESFFIATPPGTQAIAEVGLPDGWTLTDSTCDTGQDPAAVLLSESGHIAAACTFTNSLGPAETDLRISKNGSTDPVVAGQSLSYEIVVENLGIASADDVTVTDLLPPEIAFASATSTQGSCTHAAGTVVCDLGSVAAGNAVTVTLVVDTSPDLPDGALIDNEATVGSSTVDPNPANNTAQETIAVEASSDLSISKSAAVDPAVAGGVVVWEVTVANAGPSDAPGVTMVDSLPAGVTLSAATVTVGSGPCTGAVTCELGTLPAGSIAVIEIIGVVDPSLPAGATLTNSAAVTSTNPDPNTDSNTAVAVSAVATAADLAIVKSSSPNPYVAGDPLTYSLTVTNAGPSDAAEVTLVDVLPPSTSFVSAAAGQGSCTEAAGTVTCHLGTLAAGSSASVTVDTIVDAGAVGNLENTASVAALTEDPGNANNTALDSNPGLPPADLSVAKVATGPAVAGEPLTYLVSVANAGPGDAPGTILTDTLPIGVPLAGADVIIGSGSCSEGGGVLTCDLGTLPPGTTAVIEVVVDVPPAAGGAVLSNAAGVASDVGDPNTANDTATVDATVTGRADLSLVKASEPDPYVPGLPLTYTIAATNTGPSDAADVVVIDTLPAALSFTSATSTHGSCTETGGTVTCSLGTIAPAGSATITITTVVDPAAIGPLVNSAVISAATADPNPADNTAANTNPSNPAADLRITKSADADPVTAGTDLTYRLAVSNAGPSAATEVAVTDVLPAGVGLLSALASQGTCNEAGGIITCDLGTMAAAATATVEIVAAIPSSMAPGTVLSNTAAVSSATPDTDPAGNAATAEVTVSASADLAVAKSSSPDPYVPGEDLTYTMTVHNAGPSDAAAVTFVDQLPPGVAFVSATPGQGTCTEAGGTVSCDLGTIADGADVTAVIVVAVEPATVGQLANTASVAASTPDPDPGDNSTTNDNPSSPAADLHVSKAADHTPVVAGTNVSFRIDVGNAGPSDASAVTVTDVLPAGLGFVSAAPSKGSCSSAGGTISCDLGTLPAASTAYIDIVAALPADAEVGAILTNDAAASSNTPDPDPLDNRASADIAVAASADVAVAKTATPDPYVPGGDLTYVVTVTNAGPSDAAGVTVTDSLPGVVFVSATPDQGSCTESAGTITCALGTVAAGGRVAVTIVTSVPSDAGGILRNAATVSAATPDPSGGNNTAENTNPTNPAADLRLTKHAPAEVTAGTSLTYTLVASNAGPSDAATVTVTDQLPDGTSFAGAAVTVGSGVCTESAGLVTCELGTLPAGQSAVVNITVDLPADAVPGTSLVNSAVVSSPTEDPDPSGNTGSVAVAVAASAEVALTKTIAPSPYVPGAEVTYSLTATNAGPSDAADVVVTDSLPPELTFVSATAPVGGCAESAGTVSCSLGKVPAGASVTITVVAGVNSAQSGPLVNTATVAATTPDPLGADNTATNVSDPSPIADLTLAKTFAGSAVAGTDITYLLSVTNAGPSDAADVVISDTLPGGVGFVSAVASQGTCAESGGIVTCSLGNLPASGIGIVTLTVAVPAGAEDLLLANTATVGSAASDPDPSDNTATSQVTVAGSADLAILKTVAPEPYVPGRDVVFTIGVTNAGPSDASAVIVDDQLPAGLTVISAVAGQGSCSVTASSVSCDVGVLAALGSTTIVVTAATDPGLTAPLTNTASVSAETPDPGLGNDGSTAASAAAPSADLSLTKSGPDTVVAGETASYLLSVTNDGPSSAADVIVSDPLPPGTTLDSAVPEQGTCSETAGVLTCDLGTVAPGSVAVEVTVLVSADAAAAGTIVNTAALSTGTADPDTSDHNATAASTVATSADLAITKAVVDDPAVAGQSLSYLITVHNAGPSYAGDVSVTDVLPVGTTFVTASTEQGSCIEVGGTVTCDLGSVAPGTVDITVVVVVDSWVADGSSLVNTTTLASSTPDPEPANDEASATAIVVATADLRLSKSVVSGTPVAGANLVYLMTVVNQGPSDAAAVVVTDTLPGGTTYAGGVVTIGSGSCSEAAGTVTCDLGTLPAGETRAVEISVVLGADLAGVTLTNDARVSSATTDLSDGNDSSVAAAAVTGSADLTIFKSSGPDPYVPGLDLTYTLSIVNIGPSEAEDVVVTDTLPGGVVFKSATPAQGTCAESAGVVTCDLATIPDGATVPVVVVVHVDPGATGELANTATVTAATPDPDPGGNTATDVNPSSPAADLRIGKTALADPVTAGTDLTYHVTVVNLGPSDAADVIVTDALPSGVVFRQAAVTMGSGTCTEAFGIVSCDIGSLPAGQLVLVEITVGVPGDAVPGALRNEATVAASTPDPTPGNDAASLDTGVALIADLALVKTSTPSPFIPGSDIAYTISVTNAGPSNAPDVALTDELPAGVAFVSATPDQGTCGESGSVVTCSLGMIADGATVTVRIVVTTAPDLSGPLVNVASAVSSVPDPGAGNDDGTDVTGASPRADLAVTKTSSAEAVVAGTELGYTVSVINEGPSDAIGVTVTDELPEGVVFVAATPDQGTCEQTGGVVTCALGELPAGQSAAVAVVVEIPADTAPGSIIVNVASVSSASPDPDPGDNAASAATEVTASADLSLVKTSLTNPLTAGSTATYSLTISNAGPSDALGVVVTDELPAGTSLVSAIPDQGSCNVAASTTTCNLGTVPAFGSAAVRIVVDTAPDLVHGSTIANSAGVAADTPDPDPSGNVGAASLTVVSVADLEVGKTAASHAVAGGTVDYVVTVVNHGPSDAVGVVVNDNLPAAVAFVSALTTQGDCTSLSGTVTCRLGTMVVGGTAEITIVGAIAPDLPSGATLTNTATATSETTDPSPGNDAGTAATTISLEADLAVEKTHEPAIPVPGEQIRYMIVVRNDGPGIATDAHIGDTLPEALTAAAWTCEVAAPSSSYCAAAAGTGDVDVTVTLSPGETATVMVEATVDPEARGQLVNAAYVTPTVPDPDETNNSAVDLAELVPHAELVLTKTADDDAVQVGDPVRYELRLDNLGPSSASSAAIVDELPPGLSFVSADPPGVCTEAGQVVTCTVGAIAPGDGASVELTALVTGGAGSIANVATAVADQDGSGSATVEAAALIVVEPTGDVTSADQPEALPTTGRDLGSAAVVALLLLLGGSALVVAARLKRARA